MGYGLMDGGVEIITTLSVTRHANYGLNYIY